MVKRNGGYTDDGGDEGSGWHGRSVLVVFIG